ncbi:MAG: hypothetical protein NTZ12_10865 [Candidatus Aminicenantes bacterium]|nr:hypothetical protein [Candidatus Aminicenantes bacterium]
MKKQVHFPTQRLIEKKTKFERYGRYIRQVRKNDISVAARIAKFSFTGPRYFQIVDAQGNSPMGLEVKQNVAAAIDAGMQRFVSAGFDRVGWKNHRLPKIKGTRQAGIDVAAGNVTQAAIQAKPYAQSLAGRLDWRGFDFHRQLGGEFFIFVLTLGRQP